MGLRSVFRPFSDCNPPFHSLGSTGCDGLFLPESRPRPVTPVTGRANENGARRGAVQIVPVGPVHSAGQAGVAVGSAFSSASETRKTPKPTTAVAAPTKPIEP